MTDPPIRRRAPLTVLRSRTVARPLVPTLFLTTLLLTGACSGGSTVVSDGATDAGAPGSSIATTAADRAATVTTPPPASGRAAGAVVEVDLRLVAFVPATVEVPARSTVRWVQHDPGAHTVTSGTVVEVAGGVEARPDGVFDSARLEPGGQFEFTPDATGSLPYFCRIHPATMRGVVTVR